MKTAFLFPGQGSQHVGMGKDIHEKYDAAKEVYALVSEISGVDVATISFSGPAARLRNSDNTQLAILTMSLAIFHVLIEKDVKPFVMAGHSLGEYSSIIASGAVNMKDGIMLVKKRGELMAKACLAHPGSMAAVIGLSSEEVATLCRLAENIGSVWPANLNTPAQIVASGTKPGVKEVMKLARKQKAKAIPLDVAGAFHSPLMASASLAFSEVVKDVAIRDPAHPVIGNRDASMLVNAEDLSREMGEHMLSCVQWSPSMEKMKEMGVEAFIEVGPKNVLKGLMLRMDRKAKVFTTGKVNELDRVIRDFTS